MPSVALGTLLTRNLVVVLIKVIVRESNEFREISVHP